jgi:hypothetical protein
MPMQLIGTRSIKDHAVTGPKIRFAPDNVDDLGEATPTAYRPKNLNLAGQIQSAGGAQFSGNITCGALITGGTMRFAPTATYDIGMVGSFKPRDLYLSGNMFADGSISLGGTPAVLTSEGGDIKSLGALKAGNGYLFVDDCMIHREAANHLKFVGRFDTDDLHISTSISLPPGRITLSSGDSRITAPGGYGGLNGLHGALLGANAEFDGAAWLRIADGSPAGHLNFGQTSLSVLFAPTGSGAPSFATQPFITSANGDTTVNRLGINGATPQAVAGCMTLTYATTTSATTGSASALPAVPAGYWTLYHPNGQAIKVPFYLA